MKKYELQPTDLTTLRGKPLFQVVALRGFGAVLKGDKGGYVESEANLSHDGDCWVFDSAGVFDDARVFGDARVYDSAGVSGDAWVYGNARVFNSAQISGDAWVYGDAWVFGAACNHDNCPKCGEKL